MLQELKNETEFNTLIEKHDVVVVDFFATWCGPCKTLAPVLEKLSNEYKEKGHDVLFLKIDSNVHEDLVELHNVAGLPTLVFYKKGVISKYVIEGAPEKESEITDIVNKLL